MRLEIPRDAQSWTSSAARRGPPRTLLNPCTLLSQPLCSTSRRSKKAADSNDQGGPSAHVSHRARWPAGRPAVDCEAPFPVGTPPRPARCGAGNRAEVACGESRRHMAERTVVHDTIVTERPYGRPPDRVFAAWRDPATKREWFAEGEGWRIDEYGLGFRVGGREHGRFRRGNGPEPRNETVYLDIVPDRRIVMAYTMALDGKTGRGCRSAVAQSRPARRATNPPRSAPAGRWNTTVRRGAGRADSGSEACHRHRDSPALPCRHSLGGSAPSTGREEALSILPVIECGFRTASDKEDIRIGSCECERANLHRSGSHRLWRRGTPVNPGRDPFMRALRRIARSRSAAAWTM
jgi:uncharacterized protein YndB with AHSA1/START domain